MSLWPSITELLVALGVGDRVVGRAFTDQSPPQDSYAAAVDRIPVLASDAVSAEKLYAARPDLVIADGEYHFNGKELPTMAALGKLGIPVYIISSFCNGHTTTGKVTDIYTDLRTLGAALDVQPTATRLAAQVKARLSADQKLAAAHPTVPLALVQIYSKQIYAEAGGLYTDVVARAGGRNLYDGQLPTGQYYAQISIEDLAKKNPATIVIAYNSPADRDSELKALRTALPTVRAVRQNRLIAIPSIDFIDLRAVDGVDTLTRALNPAS